MSDVSQIVESDGHERELGTVESERSIQNASGIGTKVRGFYKALSDQELVVEVLDISEEQQQAEECVVCLSNKKEIVFYPCGHQCLCSPCSERFKREAQHNICPICRNRIIDSIKLYK